MTIVGIFVFLIVLLVYSPWFSFSGTLSSGDWPYLYKEAIEEFSFLPQLDFLWLAPYYQILSKLLVQYIGIPWEVVERLFWFWPFLLLSIFSSYYLTKSWIGVLIYTANTYILMVLGGGQLGIALAYSIAPFVLRRFINLIDNFTIDYHNFQFHPEQSHVPSGTWQSRRTNFKFSIITGLILAAQMMLDPRITYVTIIAIVIYALFNFRKAHISRLILHTFVVPIAIALALNFYWIIPVLKHGLPEGVGAFGNLASFEFLSFADFSHTFSMLHPNWPENIFGKTYFLQPEFIILPVIAYSSLLFMSNIKNQKSPRVASFPPRGWNSFTRREILFFCILGLLGAFLAKGSNPPFGEANIFLFEHFPGMSMFRDPSKFYVLIALSYSALVPFSLAKISDFFKFKIYSVFLIFTICYLLFLIRPALFGQLTGTFKTYQIPQEYITLKEFLKDDLRFSKTLWISQRQRFGFYSKNHPSLSAQELFNENDSLIISNKLNMKSTMVFLKQQKVRYIIIPFDSQEELFLKDRKYTKSLREQTEKDLDKLQNLVKKKGFGNITVYEIQ